jgi:hypothetical protein
VVAKQHKIFKDISQLARNLSRTLSYAKLVAETNVGYSKHQFSP